MYLFARRGWNGDLYNKLSTQNKFEGKSRSNVTIPCGYCHTQAKRNILKRGLALLRPSQWKRTPLLLVRLHLLVITSLVMVGVSLVGEINFGEESANLK